MVEADFTEFSELLDAVCSLLSRGAYVPNGTNTALFFRALQDHPINAVRDAFEAHVKDPQRGRFVPTPADVIAQLLGATENDGRRGTEEAWAMSLQAADEAVTLVRTDEMAMAWGVAQPVFALGDKVGARMAFREAYERLVAEARKARQPVRWLVSEGHDKRLRADVVRAAVADGRLSQWELQALPAPPVQPLLELVGGTELSRESEAERTGRAALRALRNRLAQGAGADDEPGRDGQAKAHTRRRQDEIAEQTRQALEASSVGNGAAKAAL
jgi:hypothetical protein